jgi:hypothetical protein
LEPLVGFDFAEGSLLVSTERSFFNEFSLVVNDEPQDFTYRFDEQYKVHTLLYTPKFIPGKNIIFHEYILYAGNGSAYGKFEYILTTGARWKGGVIGEIEIIIEADIPGVYEIEKSLFSGADIRGTGKQIPDGTPVWYNGPSFVGPTRITVIDGFLYKRLLNYRPTENIKFRFRELYYAEEFLFSFHYAIGLFDHTDKIIVHFHKYIYYWRLHFVGEPLPSSLRGPIADEEYRNSTPSIMPDNYGYEEFAARITPAELRIMRNTVYAMYGYVFNNPELQEYFNNQYWYFPNPEINNENITFSEIDAKILQYIIYLEGR